MIYKDKVNLKIGNWKLLSKKFDVNKITVGFFFFFFFFFFGGGGVISVMEKRCFNTAERIPIITMNKCKRDLNNINLKSQ